MDAICKDIDFRATSFWVRTESSIRKKTACEASVKFIVYKDGKEIFEHRAAEGDNQLAALNSVFVKALMPHFPFLNSVNLAGFGIKMKGKRFIIRIKFFGFGRSWKIIKKSKNPTSAVFHAVLKGYKIAFAIQKQNVVV